MYVSIQTGWILIHQTAANGVNYFGYFLRKVIEYLGGFECTEDCVQNNCERRCRGQSSDRVGHQPIIGDDLDGRIVDLGPSSKTGAAGNHRKTCWMVEFDETQCLNGGSCFAIELHNGMRRAGCSCPPNWTGERCEMRYIDPGLWEIDDDSIHTAAVRSETLLLVFVGAVLITSGYLYLRYQKRQMEQKGKVQSSETLVGAMTALDDDSDCVKLNTTHQIRMPSSLSSSDISSVTIEDFSEKTNDDVDNNRCDSDRSTVICHLPDSAR